MESGKQLLAEFVGTFWLVFGGLGAAILAANDPDLKSGVTGVALAFGLTLLTMAYVIGPISGCHINPAVTIGLWAGGRFPARKIVPYIIAQILGGIAGAGIAYAIASGKTGFDISTGPGANGYGIHSPSGYSMWAGFLVEVVLTLGFVFIVLGSTDIRVPKGFGPIPVGLALTLVHLIGIPVTNMSVNPARSLGPAVFAGGWALSQLWLFWVAPLTGAIISGLIYRFTPLKGGEALLALEK
ncbi:MAG: aquaporin Z [Fibrobacter sp.]|nr:aquaporin Z [Fibrobacter sp.]